MQLRMKTLLCIILLCLTLSSGSDRTSKKQYHVYTISKINWHGAFIDCLSRGLQLATVETAEEQAELEKAIKTTNAHNEYLWLSGTDLHQEGQFVWMSTGNAISYKNWDKNEPNNCEGKEHCMHILSVENKMTWNDEECSDELYYVCETRPSGCFVNVIVD